MKMNVSLSALLATLVLFLGLLVPAPALAIIFPSLIAPAQIPATGQVGPTFGLDADADLQKGVSWPDPRFSDLGDGTVQDQLTGLIWAGDAGSSVASCGGAGAMTWDVALDYVACLNTNHYLGHSDWILPNINELRSLLSLGEASPAITPSHPFIDLQSTFYWSSTTSASNSDNAWIVDFSDGYLASDQQKFIFPYYVWPLRQLAGSGEISLAKTGQTISSDLLGANDDGGLQRGVSAPPPRYVDNNDGTVTDTQTFLVWAQESNSAGPAACLDPGFDRPWMEALDFVACLNDNSYLGQSDWRLPNANELTSLLDYGQTSPSLGSGHPFNLLSASSFWTSTTYAPDPAYAWFLNSDTGELLPGDTVNELYGVWPVRDANWSLTVDRSGNGSVSVDSGSLSWSGATGTASYPLNTLVSLTPTADPGNTFMGWGDACSGSAACTVTMDGTRHVIATFVQDATAVTLTPGLSSPQSTKTIIPLTALATGGDSGAYEYRFWWRSTLAGSKWHVGQDYSAAADWNWDPATLKLGSGSYYLQVDTRHVGNPVNREAASSLKFTLFVTPIPATAVSLIASLATPQPAGATIAFLAKASGGDAGPYEYRFWWRSSAIGAKWTVGQNYSTNAKWSWNSSILGLEVGSYFLQVDVRHVGSTARFEAVQSLNFALTPGVTLVSNLASPQDAGTTVTFSADAKGVDAGPYEYRFWWRPTAAGGTWIIGQAYSASNSWEWNTAGLGLSGGSYFIQVDSRHVGNPARSEMTRSATYLLQ